MIQLPRLSWREAVEEAARERDMIEKSEADSLTADILNLVEDTTGQALDLHRRRKIEAFAASLVERLGLTVRDYVDELLEHAEFLIDYSRGCYDCHRSWERVETGPMLRNHVWDVIARHDERLCTDCITSRMQQRFGRDVAFEDLRPCGWNMGKRKGRPVVL